MGYRFDDALVYLKGGFYYAFAVPGYRRARYINIRKPLVKRDKIIPDDRDGVAAVGRIHRKAHVAVLVYDERLDRRAPGVDTEINFTFGRVGYRDTVAALGVTDPESLVFFLTAK